MIFASEDGAHWTKALPAVGGALYAVTWTGSEFVAVGDAGVVFASPDGLAWTERSAGVAEPLFGVTWTGSRLVAVGKRGVRVESADGVSWDGGRLGDLERPAGRRLGRADGSWCSGGRGRS